MKVWTCADHIGHWPVGAASVVVADSEERAVELLRAELKDHGLDLDKQSFSLVRLPLTKERCRVLLDGEY